MLQWAGLARPAHGQTGRVPTSRVPRLHVLGAKQHHHHCRLNAHPRAIALARLPPPSRAAIMSAAVLPSTAADITSSAPRRRSGRVTKKPEKFAPEASPAGSAKRKRHHENDADADTDASSEDEPSDSSEGEPDEQEVRDRRKKKTQSARKPPQKKPKTNGETVHLAIRPATHAKKRASKPRKAPLRKSALVEDGADGLYGKEVEELVFI